MAGRPIHPPSAVQPPYWRGISDLAGEIGDLLYGTYRRGTENFYVRNGTAIAKRRGFSRAFNQRFVGCATGTFSREGQTRYHILADGLGVQVFDTLKEKPIYGNFLDHPGYPLDAFDRADSAVVSNSSGPPQERWVEGQIQTSLTQFTDYGSNWEIANQAAAIKVTSTTAETGVVQHLNQMPGAMFVSRIELDFSGYVARDGQNTINFLTAAGGRLLADGAFRSRLVDINEAVQVTRGEYGSRTGAMLQLNVNTANNGGFNTRPGIQLVLYPFCSSHKSGDYPASGYVEGGYTDDDLLGSVTLDSFGDLAGSHVIEFGIAPVSAPGGYKIQARFWSGKTLADMANNSMGDADITLTKECRVDEAVSFYGGQGTGYFVLPWGDLTGTNFGFTGSCASDGASESVVGIDEIQGAFEFHRE